MRPELRSAACHALAWLATIVACAVWTWQGTGRLTWGEAMAFVWFGGTAGLWGWLGLRGARLDAAWGAAPVALWPLGTLFVSGVAALARVAADVPLAVTLMLLAVVGGLALAAAPRARVAAELRPTAGWDLLAIVVSLLAATFWTSHWRPSWEESADQLFYRPMSDYYVHAHQISLLASPIPVAELGRYGLAGTPIRAYHYGSYALPALLSQAGGQSALATLTSLWTPLGLALVGCTVYQLGKVWFGPGLGWCGLLAVLVVPDSTFWTMPVGLLGHDLCSWHRLSESGPANTYGCATCLWALAAASQGRRTGDPRQLLTGLIAGAAAVFFKAQICLAAAPVMALVALPPLVGWLASDRRRWVAAGVACVPLAVVAAVLAPFAPPLSLEWPPGDRYLSYLFTLTANEPLWGTITAWVNGLPTWFRSLLAPLAIAAVAFRLGLLLVVAAWLWGRRTGDDPARPGEIAHATLAVLLAYGLFLAPKPLGNELGYPWELQHIPFLWSQAVLFTWASGVLVPRRWVAADRPGSGILLASGLALLLPWFLGRDDMPPDRLTTERFVQSTWPRGLAACADFLRDRAAPGDRFLDAEDDRTTWVESLAERRIYVGWSLATTFFNRPEDWREFRRRVDEHARLRAADDREELARLAAACRVRWYLLHPQVPVAWPAEVLGAPAFSAHGYRVYDLERLRHKIAAPAE